MPPDLARENRENHQISETSAFFPFQNPGPLIILAPADTMVVVAQLVEPRIVIPVVAGSSPVVHPIFPIGASMID